MDNQEHTEPTTTGTTTIPPKKAAWVISLITVTVAFTLLSCLLGFAHIDLEPSAIRKTSLVQASNHSKTFTATNVTTSMGVTNITNDAYNESATSNNVAISAIETAGGSTETAGSSSPSSSSSSSPSPPPPYNSLLPPEVVNPNVIIGGKSYSLDDGLKANQHNQHQDAATTVQSELLLEDLLPLPKPVVVVGLPKAGTTTIYDFFKNSGSKAVHWKHMWRPNNGTGRWVEKYRIGTCMHQAIQLGKPPLKTCGNYQVWAQIDVSDPQIPRYGCHYPQITNLAEIHQEVPNATFILNRRNFTDWASSFHRWKKMDGSGERLDKRLVRCKPFGPKSTSVEDLIVWHQEQIQRVRQFVLEHPSHALIEVDIQDSDAAARMSKAFQIDAKFWGQSNMNFKEEAPK